MRATKLRKTTLGYTDPVRQRSLVGGHDLYLGEHLQRSSASTSPGQFEYAETDLPYD